tara:strand:- start:2402 stop:3139 length:738 start_codon:yes stop_codon:yes gene_type:complete
MNFNKSNKVTIAKDAMGNTIRISKRNAEYSHIRITQERTDISGSGWMQTKTVSALIHGKTEEMKKSGIGRMKYLPGNIIIKEQHEPFSKSNPDRDIKRAGAGGPICRVDDQPIYRTTSYDSTGLKVDVKIEHTNSAEIKEESIGDESMIQEQNSTGTLADLNNAKVTEDELDPAQLDLEEVIAEVEAEDNITPLEQELDELLDKSEVENETFPHSMDDVTEEVIEEVIETPEVEEIEVSESVFSL